MALLRLDDAFNAAAREYSIRQPRLDRQSHPLSEFHANSAQSVVFLSFVLDFLSNHFGNCPEVPLENYTWTCPSLNEEPDFLSFNPTYRDMKLNAKGVDVFCKTLPHEATPILDPLAESIPYECVAQIERPDGYSLRYFVHVDQEGLVSASYMDETVSGSSTRYLPQDIIDIENPKFDRLPFIEHIRRSKDWDSKLPKCWDEIFTLLNVKIDPLLRAFASAANASEFSFFRKMPENLPPPPSSSNKETPAPFSSPDDSIYSGNTPPPLSKKPLAILALATAATALIWFACRNRRAKKQLQANPPRSLPKQKV